MTHDTKTTGSKSKGTQNEYPQNKEGWLRRFQKTSLPSFDKNIKKLSNPESFAGAHASEISRTILKDPSLTASVLKLANSVQFNRYGNPIRTVSRGVMLLGHNTIKEICSSCLLLEGVLSGGASESLKSVLARSFHAAIQAKEIANIRGDKEVEEIFISSLLMNIGEIAVFSSIDKTDQLSKDLMSAYPFTGGKEKDIIGCYFNELTLGLCQSWGIAPMIAETLGGHYSEKGMCRAILLANSLAKACETNGMQAAINQHTKTISIFCNKPSKELSERLISAAETTKNSLKTFGLTLSNIDEEQGQEKTKKKFEIVIDKSNQLDALQELSSLVQKKFDLNLALQLLLEGLSRGAGFNSCLIALLNPKRTHLAGKISIEKEESDVKSHFNFETALQLPEIDQKVIKNREILLSKNLRPKGKTILEINKHLTKSCSIWGPLFVENKVIGCLYMDNGSANQAISEEQISAFTLFVLQAKSLLSVIRFI
jgi:hypothetical protein